MKSKVVNRDKIISLFEDGQTLVIGGFGNHGSPNKLIQCVIDSGKKFLTVISIDAGDKDVTVGRLLHRGLVDRLICAHIGKNPEACAFKESGAVVIELTPQGSWAERVRCGGAGLGGVLTKTGLGTIVEEERDKFVIKGEEYLVEPALRGDIALVRAYRADPIGNLIYRGTSRNTNPLVATAADISVVEADSMMEIDEAGVDNIVTPSVFVDMILGS